MAPSQQFPSEQKLPYVPERLALSARALGPAGDAWLAGLPGLLAGLAADWSVTVGASLPGGSASYVAEAVTRDGRPVVLKVAIPPGIDAVAPFERQLTVLRLAGGGDPYVGLIRHDASRRALLLERLGRPMADLGWPAARQLDALTRTAARGWNPAPAGLLPSGTEAAQWHADFIPPAWAELGRPCPEAVVALAVRCAGARAAAFDPERAVLIHGDVHNLNALRAPGPGFRLVDPEGLLSEPAHDLGVIQARGVQSWIDGLAAREPRRVRDVVTRSCRHAGRLAGVDPVAIRHWAFVELVSTGLFVLRLGRRAEAASFLTVATKLAAATGSAAREPTRTTAATRTGMAVAGSRHWSGASGAAVPAGRATLFLMVGLPGAGKTTRAKELAGEHRALRLTPDEWMIPLFGESTAGRKRDLLEGRLILVALETLRLGNDVVLDFGLWSRAERWALRGLAASAGAASRVVYLPIEPEVQRARIAHRQATAPHTTFPMSADELVAWRGQFEVPDAAELGGGGGIPGPPAGWAGWPEWAADRWPSLSAG